MFTDEGLPVGEALLFVAPFAYTCWDMSLSNQDIKTLINLKAESPNLDYKRGFVWTDKDRRDDKLEIINQRGRNRLILPW